MHGILNFALLPLFTFGMFCDHHLTRSSFRYQWSIDLIPLNRLQSLPKPVDQPKQYSFGFFGLHSCLVHSSYSLLSRSHRLSLYSAPCFVEQNGHAFPFWLNGMGRKRHRFYGTYCIYCHIMVWYQRGHNSTLDGILCELIVDFVAQGEEIIP